MYKANRRHWTLYLPIGRNLSRWTLKIITPANIDWNYYGNWHELPKKKKFIETMTITRAKKQVNERTNERMVGVGTCRIPGILMCKMLHFWREIQHRWYEIYSRFQDISNFICQVSIWLLGDEKSEKNTSLREFFYIFELCTILSSRESRTNRKTELVTIIEQ